ncbi:MAG TPA: ABC transporter ATP-binding protein [Alphaproteobacteria bacterium]
MNAAAEPAPAPLIRLEGVAKSYGAVTAVRNVSLDIAPGEFFSLLGPSGCGKTTLLRLIAGFETPDAGRIIIDGVDMAATPPWHRPVNTVFQSYALFPHMSVRANIAFGLKQERLPAREIDERVRAMLALVRLEDQAGRKPAQLSGGQRQRVALARALAKLPKALLLDEPLAALDRKLRDEMQAELAAIQRRVGIAFIFVTHDQDEAMTLSDRLAVMHDGAVEQEGAPRAVYERPASRYVADFLGRANVIAVRVTGHDGAMLRLRSDHLPDVELRAPAPAGVAEGASVWLAVRPENIAFAGPGHQNRVHGTVAEAAYAGNVSRYVVDLGCAMLRVVRPNSADHAAPQPARGDRVEVTWPAAAGVVLTR